MKRRDILAMAGGAVTATGAWRAVVAQPAPIPRIGFLGSNEASPEIVEPFLAGLAEGGFQPGRNVAVEYRWAANRLDRLPELMTDLMRRPLAVVVTSGGVPAARAAIAAASDVPVVFEVGRDPVQSGLVASLGRPGGNATGVHMFTADLNAKRFELLREMVPRATSIAVLINPDNVGAHGVENVVRRAAAAAGVKSQVLRAANEREIDAAFAALAASPDSALIVGNDAFFNSRRAQLVAATTRLALPAIFEWRAFAIAGGLMSYGTDFAAVWRQVGAYTARVLKGDKPAELPIVQPTRFELVINRKTAKALGLAIPQSLLLRADEVIE
ncbi:MAG: ABC transporter substrate-binding protein [Burkholderiaceae bacterium]